MLPPRLYVAAAVLLATLCAAPQAQASPAATPELVVAKDGDLAESVPAVDATPTETGTPDTGTPDTGTPDTGTTDPQKTVAEIAVNDPPTLDPGTMVQRHEEEKFHAVQHAVPLPTRRWGSGGDKRLRHDRGMLAAGIIFTAVCGAGAGLSMWAIVEQRGRTYGSESRNAVGAFTGLLTCTVGALALAATGAARLKKRRGR